MKKIILLLLSVFLLGNCSSKKDTTMIKKTINIRLPHTRKTFVPDFMITITKSGLLYDKKKGSLQEFKIFFKTYKTNNKSLAVTIKGYPGIKFARMLELISYLRTAGVKQLTLATVPSKK